MTGKKPAQQDYHDLIDSMVHKDEVEAINATVINERINNYDTSLREVGSGSLASLGDVLQILQGFDTSDDVADLLAAAGGAVSWGNIQNRPAGASVIWDEQNISVDQYAVTTPASPESIQSVSIVRSIGALSVAQRAVILDIIITQVNVQWIGVSWPTFPVTRIRGIVIGKNPRITLT